jgi:bacterioferritin-associated ferredoxin
MFAFSDKADIGISASGLPMIVCSCNVLSDVDVRTVAYTATRRTTSYVYGCLGCRARCGRCARSIREIMDEVFDGAKVGRADGGAVLARPADKQP